MTIAPHKKERLACLCAHGAFLVTPRQIELVQSSFRSVLLVSESTAQLFYARLFAIEPELQQLFTGDMKQQAKLFMHALGAAVAWLNKFNSVVPSLEALAQRHLGYGVKPEHYAAMEEALLWALERALGEAFTDEVRSAWLELYARVAGPMKQAAYGSPNAAAS